MNVSHGLKQAYRDSLKVYLQVNPQLAININYMAL